MYNPQSDPTARKLWLLPLILALMTIAVRLLLILNFPDVRDDLRIYTYYGRMMAQGLNPYLPPGDGSGLAKYANIAPLNLALFAGVLRLWDSPTALRILFALVDGAIILLIGHGLKRSRSWRMQVMIFYALNPLVLTTLVIDAEDKVVVILMTLIIIAAVEASHGVTALVWTTLLTLYRWLGTFFVLPLTLYFARTWRSLFAMLASYGLVFALSHIPYWPANLLIYQNRAQRALINPPGHDSPTMLLAALGLCAPQFVTIFIAATLGILYVLFLLRRVSLTEVIVLASFFPTMVSPELPPSRIVMVCVPLFVLITMARRRLLLVWLTTTAAALFVYPDLQTRLLGVFGLPLVIPYGSKTHMVLVNLLPALLLAFYFIDKWRGRVARDTRLPAGWLLERFLNRAAREPAAPTPSAP